MLNEPMHTEQQLPISMPNNAQPTTLHLYHQYNQESTLAALALLLGPETSYTARVHAARRLARQGPSVLPILLTTLNTYPEITSPPWPYWPSQYEHCSRLLLHLCHSADVPLETLLHHPMVSQPVGPVLWISIIEAADLQPHANYELLLCQALTTSWHTTHYAAAMALANLAGKVSLAATTLELLHGCQHEEEPVPLRLAASYALLRNADNKGVEVLMQLIEAGAPTETRKAAIFVLAAEPPLHLCSAQRSRLIQLLLNALQDQHSEIGLHAARALSHVALPTTLPSLCSLLHAPRPQVQIATLSALEEIVSRKAIRRTIYQHTLPAAVVPLLRHDISEVRRQASYTLAAFGGEYAAAVLGTTLLNQEHPGHLEAIEGLRLLQGVLRAPIRTRVVRWLLCALRQSSEEIQITTLDSLAYLIWQARTRGHQKAYADISSTIFQDGLSLRLLASPHAWVRQRTIELLSMLANQPPMLQNHLLHLLHTDNDSGVRACAAYVLGELAARWAIPDLLQTLLDSDEHVAETALNALGRLASPDDVIVDYIVRELAQEHQQVRPTHRLARAARRILKKWRKASRVNDKQAQTHSYLL